jgi:Ring finger domain
MPACRVTLQRVVLVEGDDVEANKKDSHNNDTHNNDTHVIFVKSVGRGGSDDGDDWNESSHEQCAVCLRDYRDGDVVAWSHNPNCHHIFHKECMSEWLMKHSDCPICRRNFLSLEPDEYSATEPGHEADDDESTQVSDAAVAPFGIFDSSGVPYPAEDLNDDNDRYTRGLRLMHQLRQATPSSPTRREQTTTVDVGFDEDESAVSSSEITAFSRPPEVELELQTIPPVSHPADAAASGTDRTFAYERASI